MSAAVLFPALIHGLFALLVAPALVGLTRWVKARLQSRRGAVPWQPYRELAKLLRKERIVSQHASWVFRLTPYMLFGTTFVVSCLIPIVLVPSGGQAFGDLIAVVYLLILGTFWLALAGLDPGSAFGGMGSSREMTVAALTEPTMAIAIFALALPAGSTDLGQIVRRTLEMPASALGPGHILAFAALFVVTLAESGRLPVANPSTHLELTMIHEAMVIEYSGPYLALVEWASALKLFVFCVLLANLFVPWGVAASADPLAIGVGVVAVLLKLAAIAVALALFETRVAKLRLFRVPELLTASFVLSVVAVVSAFLGR